MTTIFIRFSEYQIESPDEIKIQWAMFSENDEPVYESSEKQELKIAAKSVHDLITPHTRIIILIPGELVLLTEAEFKKEQLKYISETLPFVLEDKLADDAENLHFAIGCMDEDDEKIRLPVGVIKKSYMRQMMDALKHHNLHPDVAIPETLALTFDRVNWSAIINNDMVIVRTNENHGYCAEKNIMPVLLKLHQQRKENEELKKITLLNSESSLPLKLRGFNVENKTVSSDTFGVLCRSYLEQDISEFNPINMLYGEFSPKDRDTSSVRNLRVFSYVILVSFIFYITLKLSFAWYLNHKAAINHENSTKIYKELFPEDQKIIDLRKQIEGKVRIAEKRSSPDGFLPLLFAVSQSINDSGDNNIKIIHIDYDNNIMKLSLEANNKEATEILKQNISKKGMVSENISTENVDDKIIAKIAIKNENSSR